MTFITTIPVDQATDDVRAMYEQYRVNPGYVPNYAKAFSHRPQVMAAWSNLIGSISSTMDPRRYELVTLAAAGALRGSYCMLAHGTTLRRRFYAPAQLTRIAQDYTDAGLEPAEVAMMAFAEQIARDAAAITEGDLQVLRDHGFADAEIFDIAAAASARCFFVKLLDALGVEPDAAYLELEDELREQLLIGRPISQATTEQLPASSTEVRQTG